MKKLYTFYILMLLVSCEEVIHENDLYGDYVPINYKNTLDTIQLKPRGVYYRRVFDINNKLVLEMDGKWSLGEKNIIHFDSYFLNLDRDLTMFPELLRDTLGGGGGLLEIQGRNIEFCVGYYEGESCYKKVK